MELLLALLYFALPAVAQRWGPPPDPFADPRHDPYNPLRYIASDALTGVAVALYISAGTALAWSMWKWGAKWMLCMVIGAYTFTLGLCLRFGLARDPHSKGIYIAEYLFVVLSPCAFIAADYILLGRLTRHIGADKYLFIRPDWVTRIFLTSDVVTFLIQAAGGGLSTNADSLKRLQTGTRIFLSGLALQMASFFLFTSLFLTFIYRVRKDATIWQRDIGEKWYNDWRALAVALAISCVGILIRSVFRTAELSQGFHGHLATTEGFFYGLDTYPLFVAISIYIPFWPGRFIRPETAAPKAAESSSMEMEAAPEKDVVVVNTEPAKA